MMALSVVTEPTFRQGSRTTLFNVSAYRGPGSDYTRPWDVHPDGDRFLMIKEPPAEGDDEPDLVVVLNWTQELLERVPVN